MRFLFSSTSGSGHVQPMLALARALRERGHAVSWATGADACAFLSSIGITAFEAGESAVALMAEYRRRWPESLALDPSDTTAHLYPRLFGELATPSRLSALLELIQSWRPDVIVHDAAEFAAPLAATLAGLPHVAHAFGPTIPRQRVAATAAAIADLWAQHGLDLRRDGGLYDDLYIDIMPTTLQSESLAYIQRVARMRPDFESVDPDVGLPPALAQALRRYASRHVVLLCVGGSLGVAAATSPADVSAMHVAVEGIGHLDAVVVVESGVAELAYLADLPAHVLAIEHVALHTILPLCSAVVSCAEPSSVLAGLARGLPQLMLPHDADQMRCAFACSGSGAGVTLTGDDVTADRIEQRGRLLLADGRFRARAVRLRGEIAMMPSADETAALLEHL